MSVAGKVRGDSSGAESHPRDRFHGTTAVLTLCVCLKSLKSLDQNLHSSLLFLGYVQCPNNGFQDDIFF